MSSEKLSPLLKSILDRHFAGKKSLMAQAIGMTESPLGKAVEGKSTYFGVEACLRLAAATGESATELLRASGKEEVAELMERLYGVGTHPLSDRARELAERWDNLAVKDQDAVERIVNSFSPIQVHKPKQKARARAS